MVKNYLFCQRESRATLPYESILKDAALPFSSSGRSIAL